MILYPTSIPSQHLSPTLPSDGNSVLLYFSVILVPLLGYPHAHCASHSRSLCLFSVLQAIYRNKKKCSLCGWRTLGSGASLCKHHRYRQAVFLQGQGFWAIGCCFFITLSFAYSTYTYRFHISLLPLNSQIAFLLLFPFVMPPLFLKARLIARRPSTVHSLLLLRIQLLVLCDGEQDVVFCFPGHHRPLPLRSPTLCQAHLIRPTVYATFFLFEITDSTTHTANCAC